MPLMEQHGVEPVCQELHIAPETYYWQRKQQQSPELRSICQRRDEELGFSSNGIVSLPQLGWKKNNETF
ncbi:hypothetical protein ACZ87_03983 [Candidatus Erwinia dacicola]|uniref:Transposase n=1 Tax=Candidatus Erwinia dacicola TaxID=252393 RepID=A0A328T9K4_9GAMM|nr:hypothetical protein ACZ87_03983 [Candidatus Erwinia dacicola]